MIDILKRVKKVIAERFDDSSTLYYHLGEEVGEVATCLHNKIRPRKELKESTPEECVDVILCALGLFFEEGGDQELFDKTVEKKMTKWETRIERLKQQGKNKQ